MITTIGASGILSSVDDLFHESSEAQAQFPDTE
jgi:hypothetical protein